MKSDSIKLGRITGGTAAVVAASMPIGMVDVGYEARHPVAAAQLIREERVLKSRAANSPGSRGFHVLIVMLCRKKDPARTVGLPKGD